MGKWSDHSPTSDHPPLMGKGRGNALIYRKLWWAAQGSNPVTPAV